MNYIGKTVWVTGASSGIGKAIALELSTRTAKIILSGRNEDALLETAAECEKNGSETQCVSFDLGNIEDVEKATKKVLTSNEQIHSLINVGGISQRSFVKDTPLEVDRKVFEVNFFGTVALSKVILQHMISKGGGQIAATSSIVGKFGFPYRSAYAASKHALHGFFESLRAENKMNNITVSIIIPGRINTNISLNAINDRGEKHGMLDEGQAKGMNAMKCARIIVKKLTEERKEILVGGKELLMVHIRRFLPFLYYKLSSKVKPL